jgi:predicted lipid-binding transport protein (Tim44 family)
MMNPWLEGVLGTVAAALMIGLITAVMAAIRGGLASLRANTAAIEKWGSAMVALQEDLKEWRGETKAADAQISARVQDLETWRTAVTASLFRVVGNVTGQPGP